MEKAYLEKNTRDYEVTQSFSIALLNPDTLIKLKQDGNCMFTIPEIAFDLFYPGSNQAIYISSSRVKNLLPQPAEPELHPAERSDVSPFRWV